MSEWLLNALMCDALDNYSAKVKNFSFGEQCGCDQGLRYWQIADNEKTNQIPRLTAGHNGSN